MSYKKISLLPEKVSNLIAAGEVVERPASVIKELVENSIDAEANTIEVEVKKAGLSMMRVIDDGLGMEPEDARLAFSRHATSKILVPEDLEKITTLGFRGEALPSIASVAKVDLLTRLHEKDIGFHLTLQAGQITYQGEVGCPPGTTISIQDLFYNTPARKKFMKTPLTEQSHITETVELLALAYPNIRFKLLVDGKEVFNCPRVKKLSERLLDLYGKSLPQELLPFEQEAGGIWLHGLLAGPQNTRPNRREMHFFINQRPVEHRGLFHAVLKAYRPLIPEGRYPICYLFIDIPINLVDVNVHPSKREVRFQDEHAVYEVTKKVIEITLQKAKFADLSSILKSEIQPDKNVYGDIIINRDAGTDESYSANRVKDAIAKYCISNSNLKTQISLPIENENQLSSAPVLVYDNLWILGQVGRTYIAGHDQEGFFLIDQHAAHERIIYEKLRCFNDAIPQQALLVPITFEVTPSRAILLNSIIALFEKLGIEITNLGKNIYSIHTQPVNLEHCDIVAVVQEIVDYVAQNEKMPGQSEIQSEVLKSLACHSAIKAGDKLPAEVMEALLCQLKTITTLPTCPHGRPYIFRLSWKELEKIFKRRA